MRARSLGSFVPSGPICADRYLGFGCCMTRFASYKAVASSIDLKNVDLIVTVTAIPFQGLVLNRAVHQLDLLVGPCRFGLVT